MLKTQDFLNMEFAFKYGMWELLKHEQISETHVLAILLTGNALQFYGKKISLMSGINDLLNFFLDFWRCALHRSNGKLTLNLWDTQVFKTKTNSIFRISGVANVFFLVQMYKSCLYSVVMFQVMLTGIE